MQRFLVIAIGACAYVVAASFALAYLPFSDVPVFLGALFTKGWQASLIWMKARHFVICGLVGLAVALILVRREKQAALVDAFVIGLLAVGWHVFLRWSVVGGLDHVGWLEITEYLVLLLAIAVWVPVFRAPLWQRYLKR
jgi:membrane-bound metal-dependent hydrolase YbcI (DUF457 family)